MNKQVHVCKKPSKITEEISSKTENKKASVKHIKEVNHYFNKKEDLIRERKQDKQALPWSIILGKQGDARWIPIAFNTGT